MFVLFILPSCSSFYSTNQSVDKFLFSSISSFLLFIPAFLSLSYSLPSFYMKLFNLSFSSYFIILLILFIVFILDVPPVSQSVCQCTLLSLLQVASSCTVQCCCLRTSWYTWWASASPRSSWQSSWWWAWRCALGIPSWWWHSSSPSASMHFPSSLCTTLVSQWWGLCVKVCVFVRVWGIVSVYLCAYVTCVCLGLESCV